MGDDGMGEYVPSEAYRMPSELTKGTVPLEKEKLLAYIDTNRTPVIDFEGVNEVDSAGIALLAQLRAKRKNIKFDKVPKKVMAKAKIDKLDSLLFSN